MYFPIIIAFPNMKEPQLNSWGFIAYVLEYIKPVLCTANQDFTIKASLNVNFFDFEVNY